MSRIFLFGNERLSPMGERSYASELLLQDLLSRFPEVLGESSEDGDLGRLLIEQECAVPDAEGGSGRWAMDHLFIDSEGVPTLVEVNRIQVPNRRPPLSLDWFFPPNVGGWIGLYDLTLGYEPGSSLPIGEEYLPVLGEYVRVLSTVPGGRPLDVKSVEAISFSPEAVMAQHEILIGHMRAADEGLHAAGRGLRESGGG